MISLQIMWWLFPKLPYLPFSACAVFTVGGRQVQQVLASIGELERPEFTAKIRT
jgi:hypothetical protein